jgi:superfamily I DNA and/or RNA helicase
VQAIATRLPARYRDQVKVDTAERWQGLQRELMVVVHPLSSMVNPGEFDLETGRLCVMASRHRSGLVVVGREHIGATLEGILPVASQPLGQPDAFARGLKRHRAFWHHLESSETTA